MSKVRVPDLDDLRFQELVDEAKRYLPVRAPAWTDHNVSDPGITLIEACASRVDQLSYRTNQVPDAVRDRILRLAGLTPTPPACASTQLTFTPLGGPAGADITIAADTAVSTSAAYPGPVVTFRTVGDLVIAAGTTSGVIEARNVITVDEALGVSTGVPGQRFSPSGVPFLTGNSDGTQVAVLTVTVVNPDDGTAVAWRPVTTFADVAEAEPCFLWDVVAHQVVFGPRTPYVTSGHQHGAVPVRGARIEARYDTSQGSLGNVPARTLVSWEQSASVAVTNQAPTAGGVDAETVPEAVTRTNAVLVPLGRAVTADDYAQILTDRVPGIARVHTAAAAVAGSADLKYLQVIAVPQPTGRPGEPLPDADLTMPAATAAAAGQCGEATRLLCVRVRIADPPWVPFHVAATVYSWASGKSIADQAGQKAATAALFRYFHPTVGGQDGTGWPFGRPVHVGDVYGVLAGLPETISVVDVGITNAAGTPTSWIDVPEGGLPLLRQAEVTLVASSTDEFERVPPGMWGLFSGTDGTGKLLGFFPGDADGLAAGIGPWAKSVVNVTGRTVEVFTVNAAQSTSAAGQDAPRQVIYPGTTVNLDAIVNSAVLLTQVPDGTFCLYEHPHRAGKQWIFWPSAGQIDLAQPAIGADQAVSSVLNKTLRTVQLRDAAGRTQLIRPGEAADLDPALNDQARFASTLDGPGDGQYGLTVAPAPATGEPGNEQWVFGQSVQNLPAVLGPDRTVSAVDNQTPYPVALYPLPDFMIGSTGLQAVAPRSTAQVSAALTASVGSAEVRPLGSVIAWGDLGSTLTAVPVGLTDVFAAAAGSWHWLVVRADHLVTAWGTDSYGQCSVPAGLRNVVAVAAGTWHSLALTGDGAVTAWGDNSDGQATVPAGLGNVTAIAAGGWHSMALRADGTVLAWGYQTGQGGALAVPAGLSGVVAIATSMGHALAVLADGTVTAWGSNLYGETQVPAGLSNVIAVAAGMWFSLALRSDGTVVAWGYQTGAGQINQVPAGLTGVVAVAASAGAAQAGPWIHEAGAGQSPPPDVVTAADQAMRSLALRADGSIVTWGTASGQGQTYASPAVTASRSVAVAAGETYSLAIYVTR